MDIKITSIDDIIEKYKALIIDVWGTMHDGYAPFEKTIPLITKIIREKKPFTFLSNTPRPGKIVKQRLIDWQIDLEDINLYTSGDAVREQLEQWNDEVFVNLGKKFYHLGEDRNTDLLSGLNIDLTYNIKEANFLLISAYLDEDEDIDKYDSLLAEAAQLNIPAVCANPSISVEHGTQLRYCAGYFANKYKKLGGEIHYYGKPDIKIFNTIIKKYEQMGIKRSEIVMMGDSINTDVLGANNSGIDGVLVLTGNGHKFINKIKAGESNIFDEYNAKPTWISYGFF